MKAKFKFPRVIDIKPPEMNHSNFNRSIPKEGGSFLSPDLSRSFEIKRSDLFTYYSDLPMNESAFGSIEQPQKILFGVLFTAILLMLFIDSKMTAIFIIATLTIIYFADLLFNLFLVYRSLVKYPELKSLDEEIFSLNESLLPTYTILCPLYREWAVVPQFIAAMSKLDYPTDKLQVILLLEEDDEKTFKEIERHKLPTYFQVEVIPHSIPKTKPKALNYGLELARGDYTVIYDAEDIPEPLQLKKAIVAFKKLDEKTVCVQAKLNFYNQHQNMLTRIFTSEYSLWFYLILPGLQSLGAPIPLGGTSNHFPTAFLRKIKGWDAFNVTEDCDLGMRLSKRGYKTAMIDSITLEEANSNIKNWHNQRTRWIKGYMQTYLVHTRKTSQGIENWKKSHYAIFHLIVGGKVMLLFINPLLWVVTLFYFTFRATAAPYIEPLFPAPLLYIAVFSLIFGNFFYLYCFMVGSAKREDDAIVKYAALAPIYWLMMSAAAFKALYEIFYAPHYWAKTIHGLHLATPKQNTPIT